jgi:hypothetical protein
LSDSYRTAGFNNPKELSEAGAGNVEDITIVILILPLMQTFPSTPLNLLAVRAIRVLSSSEITKMSTDKMPLALDVCHFDPLRSLSIGQ